ncbi:hypothetical protein T07_1325 [Trichinella nelsoni]|uniref:Uncharacterized protein n=1 Tax=Trichinella nelsoni TaxID=6336 RepID=A0A0V0RJN1_9BILA|nr:hypothetical protein T07_1325 [Trichinella nelsoni]
MGSPLGSMKLNTLAEWLFFRPADTSTKQSERVTSNRRWPCRLSGLGSVACMINKRAISEEMASGRLIVRQTNIQTKLPAALGIALTLSRTRPAPNCLAFHFPFPSRRFYFHFSPRQLKAVADEKKTETEKPPEHWSAAHHCPFGVHLKCRLYRPSPGQ